MFAAASALMGFEFSGAPTSFTTVGSNTYFVADDGVHGSELWKTDGTTTQMVRDLSLGDGYNPGTGFGDMAAFDGKLYFSAYVQQADGQSGYGLWKTDGTAAGTVKVRGSNPGDHFTFQPRHLVAAGNRLQFEVGNILWQSNGTAGGTKPTRDLLASQTYDDLYFEPQAGMVAVGSTFYFVPTSAYVPGNGTFGYVNAGFELWKSNGTLGGTVRVKDIWPDDGDPYNHASNPRDLTVVNNLVFFTADDGVHGRALWKSDGTAAGTVMVKDLVPDGGSDYDAYRDFTAVGGKLLFTFNDAVTGAWSLWSSDGTEAGTVMVKDLTAYSPNSDYFGGFHDYSLLVAVGNRAYFVMNPNFETSEVWVTDGTSGGTRRVAEILPRSAIESGVRRIEVTPLVRLDDQRVAYGVSYLDSNGNSSSNAVYVTDGTSVSTALDRDDVFIEDGLIAGNGTLYFNGSVIQSFEIQLWAVRFPTSSYFEIAAQPPTSVAAGQTFGFSVLVRDIAGNPATSFNGPVTVSVASKDGKLKGTLTVAAVGGTATFTDLQFEKTGSFSLTVAAAGIAKSSTSAVNVAAAAPASFRIVTQPPRNVVSGAAFGFSATLVDRFGNAAANFNGNATATISKNIASAGTLGGTTTVAAQNGVVTFTDLTLDKAGSGYKLTLAGLNPTGGATGTIKVVPGQAARLVVDVQPATTVTAGAAFRVTVTARDAAGNIATTYAGDVTVAFVANPGGATLGGKTTVKAARGIVRFTNLTINRAGAGYVLRYGDGSRNVDGAALTVA